MGKNKAQRTKNNAKPSNSSRSAELLGTSMPNFVGFSAVKDGGYVPIVPGLLLGAPSDIEINAIDSNFQLVLKKMNKKDATTKFKALQEFAQLCRDSTLQSVEAVLPFWPRLYCLLCIDVDHRVREATQVAHAALVKKVGRSIAVYLKQVAGAWFASQFDTYAPAASAATNSFQETFPQRKIVDAIVHCQEEILSYISDTITVQTPQSMSTHKSLTVEELETKYQRVLIASLQAYSSYLKKVPPAQLEKTQKSHEQIIGNGKFWKLAKHESLLVKTAFFCVLASIIDNATALIKDEKKRAMTVIFNCLDETEPGLLSAVWESMLVAINKIDDWHTTVSIDKLVLPKLWKVLKSGGQCCASVVYPNLLPFLSQFPKFDVDNRTLLVNFFTNMRQGFSAKSVQASRSELYAVAKSFAECLRYAILLHRNDEELCEELLKNQLISTIETYVKEPAPSYFAKSVLFCEIAQLVRYWSKNRGNLEYKTYGRLVEKFWLELEATLTNMMLKASQDRDASWRIYTALIELLLFLKNAPMQNRKNLRVKFSDPDDQVEEKSQIKGTEIEGDEIFAAELDRFINKLCLLCLTENARQSSDRNIVFLNRLVTNFDSETLFAGIVKSYKDDANLFDFYDNLLKNWLIEETETDEFIEVAKKREAVVQLIFRSLRYMDESKETVLKSLTELENSKIMREAVVCALSDKSRNDQVVKNWCLGSRVTEFLSNLAMTVSVSEDPNDCSDDIKIIVLAFETTSDGEPWVSEDAISNIANHLCKYFDNDTSRYLEPVVRLVCQLFTLTLSHKRLTTGSVVMLKSLFQLSLSDPLNLSDRPFIDLSRETWKSGFVKFTEKLESSELQKLHKDCMQMIYATIDEPFYDDAIVRIAVDFIEAVSDSDAGDTLRTAIEFNTSDISLTETWIPQVLRVVTYAEVLCGNFNVANPMRTIPRDRPVTFVELNDDSECLDYMESSLKWALFNAQLVDKLVAKFGTVDSAVIENSEELPYLLNYIIFIASMAHVYCCHYKSVLRYERIEGTFESLVGRCNSLRQCLPKNIWNGILNDMSLDDSWIEYGSLFSQFLKLFYGSDKHLYEVHAQGPQNLVEYLRSEDDSSDLARDLNAVATARCILSEERDNADCVAVLERMVKRHQTDPTFLLLDRNVGNVEWNEIVLPLEIIRFISKIVKTMPTKLNQAMWDASIIFLTSWQLSVNKSKFDHKNAKVRALIVAVSELYYDIQSLLSKHEQEPIEGLPSTLIDEWKNVFAEDVHLGVTETWMFYAGLYSRKGEHLMSVIVLDFLGKAMSVIDGNVLFKAEDVNGSASGRVLSASIVNLSLKLLSSPVASLQLAAHHVLNLLIPKLVEQDKVLLESENHDPNALNIRRFEEILSSTQKIVNTMLMGFKLCDTPSCTIEPHTDAYTYTMGYLLAWANVLNMCANAHADLRYQYAEVIKDDYFPFLLNNIFRLMPVEILRDNKSKSSKLVEMFGTPPSLAFRESWTEWRLDHIVCWLYANSLRYLPVLVRQWWGTADSRVSAAVEKITVRYVSPILCQEELLNKKLTSIENMQVRIHPTIREVVALYQMDDTKLELSIVLPNNHPLGAVTVEPGQHAGGSANWRNCHKQLSIFLTHQNESIWNGLLMWKRNLDKKFAGVEECFICYSIFHINTYQIPKLLCHTCRKKFHAPCLYKWFSTSQKSTCPICRNTF